MSDRLFLVVVEISVAGTRYERTLQARAANHGWAAQTVVGPMRLADDAWIELVRVYELGVDTEPTVLRVKRPDAWIVVPPA